MTFLNQNLNKTSLDFAKLGHEFFSVVETKVLDNPVLIHKNQDLYNRLNLDIDDAELLKITSGEKTLQNTQALASIYAGHQFGYFVPQLGDGRSCLIAQIKDYELSLKGAGQTPYSRGADGRAVLRSSIREYLCSIAMKGLNIATTEALSLVGSDTEVYRESIEPGAIIMRVAPSHIRFGHFELFASRGQHKQVKKLADFVIEHYYPHCQGENPYVNFFNEVVKRTTKMIAAWQAQGFTHGVMNTDNMSILGLTIDYGPFGFLETYNPKFICNHSDHQGRYAFEQQPGIALWNLTRLAESLTSLIDAKQVQIILQQYQVYLVKYYSKLMRQKFGLKDKDEQDNVLISDFLQLLHQHQKDYTHSLRQLANINQLAKDEYFYDWLERYNKRIEQEHNTSRTQMMNKVNPKYILRNYLVEVAIRKAQDKKDYREVEALFNLFSQPFAEHPDLQEYANKAPEWAQHLSVSCSS